MKKKLILSLVAGLIPVSLIAQDDLYFVPKKSAQKKVESSYETIGGSDSSTSVYVGSNRDIDEYNRKGLSKYFQKIGTDSLGNDIVEFRNENVATDTLYIYPETEIKYDMEDDYSYSRRMSRFDDYYWYDPWFYSYGYGYGPYWSPWNYRWGWYDPWYYSWYDPWYYGWHTGWGYHYGWHDPYYGWGHPVHVGGGYRPTYAHNNGITGTKNHGTVNRGGAINRPNNYGGNSVASSSSGNFGGRRNGSGNSGSNSPRYNVRSSSSSGSFGGSRNSSSYTPQSTNSTPSYSSPSYSSPSSSSGSFGGSRSSGGGGSFGGGGGSRSGGGGHSGGGGGHFGGRR